MTNLWQRCASFVAVGALIVICSQAMVAVAKKPSSSRVEHGGMIFHKQCMGCHNKQAGDTSPFGPPNLYEIFGSKPSITPRQAVEIIKEGKNVMPPFKDKLSGSDIEDIVAYLRRH
jgi:mono/diheme cytochrome c family protein